MLAMPGRYSGLRSRRAIVKVRLVKLGTNGLRAAREHLRYIRRGAFTPDGEKGVLYSATQDRAHENAFLEPCRGDRHNFRLIVSAEDGPEYDDLRPVIRRFMTRMEEDLGTRLDWIAGDHFNTMHPHTHLILRGKDQAGEDLIISPFYLCGGMRNRLVELISVDLGPVTEVEARRRRSLDVHVEHLTRIDSDLIAEMDEEGMVAAARRDSCQSSMRMGRLRKLRSLGLAEELNDGRWKLSDRIERILGEIDRRVQITTRLEAALKNAGVQRGPSQQMIHPPNWAGAITGRLLARGSCPGERGGEYLVIDGTDGRCHHVEVGEGELGSRIAEEAIIRIGRREADAKNEVRAIGDAPAIAATVDIRVHEAGVPDCSRACRSTRVEEISSGRGSDSSTTVEVLSAVPLKALPNYEGATWLDRELIEKRTPLRDSGFGREVRSALARRRDWLVENGLASDSDGHWHSRHQLLATLERRELHRVAACIIHETGLDFRPAREGTMIEGVYRRRVELASGPFAIIEMGSSFTLVPWRRELELATGRTLSGLIRRRTISWSLAHTRGLHI
jgi:type IV secretory pathway VirD2 relaxase